MDKSSKNKLKYRIELIWLVGSEIIFFNIYKIFLFISPVEVSELIFALSIVSTMSPVTPHAVPFDIFSRHMLSKKTPKISSIPF